MIVLLNIVVFTRIIYILIYVFRCKKLKVNSESCLFQDLNHNNIKTS